MLGGADNPNGELPSYITGADNGNNTAMAKTAATLQRLTIALIENFPP
ncbi:hypothetical protein [Serratia ureilytica]